jgi:hypothetical protein
MILYDNYLIKSSKSSKIIYITHKNVKYHFKTYKLYLFLYNNNNLYFLEKYLLQEQ